MIKDYNSSLQEYKLTKASVEYRRKLNNALNQSERDRLMLEFHAICRGIVDDTNVGKDRELIQTYADRIYKTMQQFNNSLHDNAVKDCDMFDFKIKVRNLDYEFNCVKTICADSIESAMAQLTDLGNACRYRVLNVINKREHQITDAKYIIYAQGTYPNINAKGLFYRRKGGARYDFSGDAEKFTEEEADCITSSKGKYTWVKQVVKDSNNMHDQLERVARFTRNGEDGLILKGPKGFVFMSADPKEDKDFESLVKAAQYGERIGYKRVH